MTVKISQAKTTKILHLYFSGMPQLKIAAKCGVNQSTISRCTAEFKKNAAVKGIIKAAEEGGVMEEVDGLRSIAMELQKHKASVEDAISGLTMVKLFDSLGVLPEEYKPLAKAVSKVKDPDYIKVAMDLAKLEKSTGKTYTDIAGEYQQLGEEITGRQETVATLKEKQEKEEESLEELELVRKQKEAEVAEFLKEAEQKKAGAKAEVNAKLAEAGLTLERIAKLHPLVEKLEELGVADSMLETYLEKHLTLEGYGINLEKFKIVAEALAKAGDIETNGLAGHLKEYGALQHIVTSMKADKESLQPQVEELKKEKSHLEIQVDERGKKKSYLEDEVKHLEEVKNTLNKVIDALPNLEKLVARFEQEATELKARDVTLAEEVTLKEKQIAEMDEKLKTAGDLDKEIGEKKEQLQELDAKITASGQRYKVFEAFLGLVGGKSTADVEKFMASSVPSNTVGLVTNSPPLKGAWMDTNPSMRSVWRRSLLLLPSQPPSQA